MTITYLPNEVSIFAFKRMFTWLTGLSLSTVLFLMFLSMLTLVLRRKGYGVRLGFACIVFYARIGSRRFPDGVEVRCSVRIVGFIFDWFRGPLIDVYIDRFNMRLRPAVSHVSTNSWRPWLRFLHFFQLGVAAVDLGYWSTLFRNVVSKLIAHFLRFFRIRIEKIRIWKDSDSRELKIKQFVFSGYAYRLSGCKYCLSINELLFKFCNLPYYTASHEPIWTTLNLQRGIEIVAYLSSNPFTVFRHRRFAILDDLRLSVNASRIACQSPQILHTMIAKLTVELQPGPTRSLLAKLPPMGPASRRANKPGLLEYWEGNFTITGVSIRITLPANSSSLVSDSCSTSLMPFSSCDFSPSGIFVSSPTTEVGLFLRLDNLHIDAYGKMAEERSGPMIHTSISLNGWRVGSSSIDALSDSLYEVTPTDTNGVASKTEDIPGCLESIEKIDKIVAARPELLIWVEEMTIGIDMNCAKHNSSRVDVGSRGGVVAIDPIGLVKLIKEISIFLYRYRRRNPQRQQSMLNDELDSLSSSSRTTSTNSLSSMNTEVNSFRIVSDMRHWTFMSVCRESLGDGDTLAIVASCEALSLSQVDIYGPSLVRIIGSSRNLGLLHWSQWARTNNLLCEEVIFDIQRGPRNAKNIHLSNATIDWDLDAHSGLQMLPSLFAALKDIPSLASSVPSSERGDEAVWVSSFPIRSDSHHTHLIEVDNRDCSRKSNKKLLETLSSWELSGTDVVLSVSFPDGPKLGLSVGKLPNFKLNTKTFVGLHVVLSIQDKKCAYAAEFKMGSFFHTLDKCLEKRTIDLDFEKLIIFLGHDVQFGFLLQDWLLRLRAAIRILRTLKWKRLGLTPPELRKVPMADIHFKCSDLELFFEDNPVSSFLTKMLPLMQDEARERVIRNSIMSKFEEQLRKIARAEIAGTAYRCQDSLQQKDSHIWVERVKQFKKQRPSRVVANGYLPPLDLPPASVFAATSLSFDLVLDDLARQMGSAESIRQMRMLDDYELGTEKNNMTRQYDRDAWNSIGFRRVGFEAKGVSVQLHDYPVPFLVMDRMYFDNTTMGQAVQATKPPYIAQATVAIGKRRMAKIEKALSPSKSFVDIHLKVDTLHSCFNPAFLPAISDFGRDISRFFSGGINPSPRIPWFDSLRFNMHGRMRLTAQTFTGVLTSSTSPYSMTDHYIEFESNNFEMLCSRLQPSTTDPFPICWKFNSWHIRPSNFETSRRSGVVFESVRVGLNPLITTESGDPQDHYFVPFPTKNEISRGGPGIGRGEVTLVYAETPVEPKDNGFGNFTNWWTGLHEISDFDSFSGFKTQSLILGIDIDVRHPKPKRRKAENVRYNTGVSPESNSLPVSSSVLYSDAISTLTKVIKAIIQRPISCRLPPRRASLQRKPPSKTGLSTSLRGMDIKFLASDMNIMLYNNLEPGNGLFVSVQSLSGELWKRTDISMMENGDIQRSSRLTRKRFDIIDVHSCIQVPGLDLAVDSEDMGKLLTIDKISLSDNLQDEMGCITSPRKGLFACASSGFGSDDLDESPFYTFSANHPLQRGNSLDKVQFDKRLLINGVRLIWSPARRISMFAWPDAFKVKTFCMKTHEAVFSEISRKNEDREAVVLSSNRNGLSEPKCDLAGTNQSNSEKIKKQGRDETFKIGPTSESDGHAYKSSGTLSSDSHQIPSFDNSTEELCLTCENSENELIDQMKSTKRTSSKTLVKPRHVGSMVDILEMDNSGQSSSESEELQVPKRDESSNLGSNQKASRCALDTLKSSPKIALFINDCEVVFGSRETIGLVFLRSKAVRIGIIDKHVQKSLQVGQRNEGWIDREYRVHLDAAELLTRDMANGRFDFGARNWVPQNLTNSKSIALVTQNPISMDLMYISSSSLPNEDGEEEEDDYILRPKLLFINIPHIRLSTSACEFHAITDVVRKVLMQSMRSSELVNEELSNLRYKLQLAGGKVTSKELEGFMRQLNSVTRQFLYAGDTFQPDLVEALLIPGETSFYDNLLRYKAKAKALATFLRTDQRATTTDILYPTMYVSYSFDECSWELREACKEPGTEMEDAFVGISLEHLVCRHIFYVGRGSSNEITFGNINALNKMQYSYFKRILQPSRPRADSGCEERRKMSGIKASDGATVAFRLYSTQDNRVGGIPVYELLTIQVAPMTAAVTRKLYRSVSDFIFTTRTRTGSEIDDIGIENQETQRSSGFTRSTSRTYVEPDSDTLTRTTSNESGAFGNKNGAGMSSCPGVKHGMDDVSQMAKRGGSNMLFKYVFIDAFELTASYKNKDTENRSALDVFDLSVRTPSYSYSSQIWSWKDFISQIRRDLATTFFLRGASNLAKMKLLPGYSRARKRLVRGAGNVKESIYSRFDAGASVAHNSGVFHRDEDDIVEDGLRDDSDNGDTDSDDQEDAQDEIDAAVVDISGAGDLEKRVRVLKTLYGDNIAGTSGVHQIGRFRGIESNKDSSSSSHDGNGFRERVRAIASGRSRISSRSQASVEDEPKGLLSRLRRLGHHDT